jgi:UDP-N-acetylglucosamine 2-epimerase (non-hydrolysing)
MSKVLVIIGTRPELIKVAPFIREMKRRGLRKKLYVLNTGQHQDLMKDTFGRLKVKADQTMDLMAAGQTLNDLCARALSKMQKAVDQMSRLYGRPPMIIAQGDTATALVAAITAFHNRIPFVHLEAGLRTGDPENPFPEENYRKIISSLASWHLTPTDSATENLRSEGVSPDRIIQCGNTVVDSIKQMIRRSEQIDPALLDTRNGNKILVTCHRRENFGEPFQRIVKAVTQLAIQHPDHEFIWLRHPNPAVTSGLNELSGSAPANVRIIPPLDYFELVQLYPYLKMIITDSGGIQEEAPSFGLPVVILRERTERIESVKAGFAHLCGSDPHKIISAVKACISGHKEITYNPYGDGKASQRMADFIVGIMNLSKAGKNYEAV